MPFPPPPRGRPGWPHVIAAPNRRAGGVPLGGESHPSTPPPREERLAPRGVKAGPPGPARAPPPDPGPAVVVDGAASVQRASTAACRTDSTRLGGGAPARRSAGAARSSAPPDPPHAAPPAQRVRRPSPAGASARRAPATVSLGGSSGRCRLDSRSLRRRSARRRSRASMWRARASRRATMTISECL